MKLEVVKTADVYADENNPREKFEGIDEMAASFDLNNERPGEPFTPPIVVRDGGIYRIVDGERRFRALKKRKAKTFHANVCENMDEALAMVAMVATDDKQPLTAAEKSKGVQMMLLLGVDPVEVDKGARLQKGTGRRIKRALDAVGDDTAAEDMSLDWLLAIEEAKGTEFEKPLIDASSTTWPTLYTEFKRQRENIRLRKEYKAVLDKHGVGYVEEMPAEGWRWDNVFRESEALEKYLDECEPGQLLARLTEYNRAECTIYRKRAVVEHATDRAKLHSAQNKWREESMAHEQAIAEWFSKEWDEDATAHVNEYVRAAREEADGMTMGWWKEMTGEDLTDRKYGLGYLLTALYLAHVIHYSGPSNHYWNVQPDGSVEVTDYKADGVRRWLGLVEAAQADGYELDTYECTIVDALVSGLDALEGGSDD